MRALLKIFGMMGLLMIHHSTAWADNAAPVQSVKQFDVDRYLGTWYEIARLPNRFQKACVKGNQAHYEKIAQNIGVTNRCQMDNGEWKTAEAMAYPQNAIGSELKVSFLPKYLRWIPFTKGDYWVMRIDEDYQVALVGEPSREFLWILARTPIIDPVVIEDYLKTATEQGYDVRTMIIHE
ncbi:lipocalin family protein [Wohlfahrtiimonas chitiniclastica]|uniref:lipocalin family protein n=1 Tax=Wohlfahrtiimonas chitiniclastica TaxID=400946 RepID=UPI001BD07032|nr:lipocalin family protein [Wohlfahrtiimonas chitiniclastica]MBS7815003.1 lipocalin family protein [Wohlfahrtiimonas chitiniclastica]